MYDHLALDFEKIKIKKECLLPKTIREFKKERRFPAWKWYEYTVPATNNKYIIFFYVDNRFSVEKPKVEHFCVTYDNYKRYIIRCGVRGFVPEGGNLMLLRELQVYTSHFFDRYKERWMDKELRFKDMSLNVNDVACVYFSRNNAHAMPVEMNDEINKHLEKYGEGARYGYRVRDGFCFTMTDMQSKNGNSKNEPIAQWVIYKTFMNESDLADTQLSAIDKSYYEAWLRYQQTMQKESMNGITSLKLDL